MREEKRLELVEEVKKVYIEGSGGGGDGFEGSSGAPFVLALPCLALPRMPRAQQNLALLLYSSNHQVTPHRHTVKAGGHTGSLRIVASSLDRV